MASPLDGVLRHHGATMVVREGHCVAAHFGSPTSETAVCLSTVGIADRSDRATLELNGPPSDVDVAITALTALSPKAACARSGSRSALVRCDQVDAAACAATLRAANVAAEHTTRFAAIGLIGPRAADLVQVVDLHVPDSSDVVVLPMLGSGVSSYELLVDADSAAALWNRLLDAGASLSIACVGLDALEHLAASQRRSRGASHTAR